MFSCSWESSLENSSDFFWYPNILFFIGTICDCIAWRPFLTVSLCGIFTLLIYRLLISFSASSVKHGFLPSSSFQFFVPLLLWLAHTVGLKDTFFQSYWYFLFFNNLLSDLVTDSPIQFSSVAQLCLTVCKPMNRIMPGLPVHY